jgi:hypothetical protein
MSRWPPGFAYHIDLPFWRAARAALVKALRYE